MGKEKLEVYLEQKMNEIKPVIEWTNEDLEKFLDDSHFTSALTVQTYVSLIKKVHKDYCENANIPYQALTPSKSLVDYVDIEKLRSKTITAQEFEAIRDELIFEDDVDGYAKGNYRDVALFDLAWYGLTPRQIKELKKSDIIECYNNEGKRYLDIKLEGRNLIITEQEIIDDILNAKKEQVYYKVKTYTGKVVVNKMELIHSPYLIRGVSNKTNEDNQPTKHIGILLNKQLKKVQLPDSPIDFEHLSLEDIRRSMILHLLYTNDNIKLCSIRAMLNKNVDADLQWLKSIAPKLYSL